MKPGPRAPDLLFVLQPKPHPRPMACLLPTPTTQLSEARIAIILLLLLVAGTWAYWPGLTGPFLFDDFPNIVQNDRLTAINDLSIESVRSAISQTEPGPVGRPISFISFAVNVALTGLDPRSFKLTNLAIHLLNGVLLFFLVRTLLTGIEGSQRSPRLDAVALVTAGAWLLHPLNLTSVLYVVQRMTELSALFVFLTLLLYSHARVRQIGGKGGAAMLFSAIPPAALLALFSKENGVLVAAYLAVLELCVFRFRAHSASTSRLLKRSYLALALTGVPIGLYVLYQYSIEYGSRDFTLAQRLLTESRILWFYVGSILLPNISAMALFHDDYVISTSLFVPLSTFIAVLALVAVIGTALWARPRAPVLAFGVLYFFSSHLLESTVIPLELVHEHRNYVGAWGLLLVGFYYLALLASRYRREAVALVLAVAMIAALAIGTRIRASYWGDELLLAQYHAHRHPSSVRTMLGAGAAFIAYATDDNMAAYREKALDYYMRAHQLAPSESKALVSIVSMLYAMDQQEALARYKELLLENLGRRPISAETINAFMMVGRCLSERSCSVPFGLYRDMARALLHNPFLGTYPAYAAKVYSANANIEFLDGDMEQALVYSEKALTVFPAESSYYVLQAWLLVSAGRMGEAKAYLDQARKVDGSSFLAERIASLEARWRERDPPPTEPRKTPGLGN